MKGDTIVRLFLLLAGNALALLLALLALQTTKGNVLGWFLFAVGIAFIAGGGFTSWARDNGGDPRKPRTVDPSFWWIIPGLVAVLFGPLLEYWHLPPVLPRGLEAQVGGLGLIVLGLSVGGWAYLAQRGLRSSFAAAQPRQLPLAEGPHRWVRHPGYLSLLLLALGLSVGYSSVIGLLIIPLLLLPGLALRMRAEEQGLLRAFGEAYRSYCQSTKRLVPGIW